MDWLQTLLDNSSTPLLTAFLLGLLTALSAGHQHSCHRLHRQGCGQPQAHLPQRAALHAGPHPGLHPAGRGAHRHSAHRRQHVRHPARHRLVGRNAHRATAAAHRSVHALRPQAALATVRVQRPPRGTGTPEATLLKKVMTWRLIGIFFGTVAFFIILSGYLFNLVL